MDAMSVAPFVAVSAVIVAAPGPSVLFAIGRTAIGGRRYGLLTVAGNAGGLFVQVVLVAAGLGTILARSSQAHTLLTVAGSGLLVWFGLGAIRRSRTPPPPGAGTAMQVEGAALDGFLVGLTNPKSLVFLAALLPQYVDPAAHDAGAQMALLGGIFCALALLLDSAWVLAAAGARTWLGSGPGAVRWISLAGGVVLVALGALLLLGLP